MLLVMCYGGVYYLTQHFLVVIVLEVGLEVEEVVPRQKGGAFNDQTYLL